MKTFDLGRLVRVYGGEYTLGAKDLHSQACYLVYGILEAGELHRPLRPGKGYEEIFCPLDGSVLLQTKSEELLLQSGRAIHLQQNDSLLMSNPSDRAIRYIMAGGKLTAHP